MKENDLKSAIRRILTFIGEDPEREGLRETPQRIERMLRELTEGYNMSLEKVINGAIFDSDYSEMVVVRDIDFYSLCEHHLLPFFGKVHVGYVPAGKIIGLSKIPRIVDMFSKRLQVQERMTEEIANAIEKSINPMGVGVVVEGYHLCTAVRGVKKINAYMVTSAMLGVFRKDPKTRSEFLSLIKKV